jgi:amicyanin
MIRQQLTRRVRTAVPLFALVILAVVLAGCGASTSASQTGGGGYGAGYGGQAVSGPAATAAPLGASQGKTVDVTIQNLSFGQPLTVPVGTTVVWTNQDDMPHTVTATNGAFASSQLAKGATFSFTFAKAGTFDYSCTIHPFMKGQVVVTK